MPGNSASRWWAITSSSGTSRAGSGEGCLRVTKRGRISVGTFTRANTVCSVIGSRTSTARLSDKLEM